MSYSHHEKFPPKLPGRDYLYQPFTTEEWNNSSFANNQELKWFKDAKYGMFIHFGLSTYKNADLSWDICYTRKAPDFGNGPIPDEEWISWKEHFKLDKFNAKRYVELAKLGGFKYLVVITKHHDGYHMWDTDESEFKITNTPFGRDIVKEIVDACHEQGMPVGLYYSQRDWYHPDYLPVDPNKIEAQTGVNWTLKEGYDSPIGDSHWKYLEYQERAVRELCTRYGKIDVFWWDALWWGGMFTSEMWDGERINNIIRELQPGIIINNRCSIPGDFDTPEKRLGAFQNWRPWESCVCLSETWSYSGTKVKSLKDIVVMLTMTACGDGNLLMSWGPHWNGEFDEVEVSALTEVGSWLEQFGETIYATRGGPWKPNTWGGSVYAGRQVYLHIISLVNDTLELPKLPNCEVLEAIEYGSNHKIVIDETETTLKFHVPQSVQSEPTTIVKLTLNKEAEYVTPIESGESSPFMDICAYGYKYKGEYSRIDTQSSITIDFGNTIKLTAVVLGLEEESNNPNITLYTSEDGNEWSDWGNVDSDRFEVEITCYESGAWIPGNNVRYVKLQSDATKSKSLKLSSFECFSR